MFLPVQANLPQPEPWACPAAPGQPQLEYDPITGACGDQHNDRSWKWVLGTIGVLFFWYFPTWLFGEPQGHLIIKAWLAKKQWFARPATPVPSEVELRTLGDRRNSDNFSQPDASVIGDFPSPHPELSNAQRNYCHRTFGPDYDPDRIEFLPPGVDPNPFYHVSA